MNRGGGVQNRPPVWDNLGEEKNRKNSTWWNLFRCHVEEKQAPVGFNLCLHVERPSSATAIVQMLQLDFRFRPRHRTLPLPDR